MAQIFKLFARFFANFGDNDFRHCHRNWRKTWHKGWENISYFRQLLITIIKMLHYILWQKFWGNISIQPQPKTKCGLAHPENWRSASAMLYPVDCYSWVTGKKIEGGQFEICVMRNCRWLWSFKGNTRCEVLLKLNHKPMWTQLFSPIYLNFTD